MVLFVNACVREDSRTYDLAQTVLAHEVGEVQEVRLYEEEIPGLTRESLQLRDELIREGKLDHPMLRRARQFAGADTVVIAAPYWDLMFPARLRAYLEEVLVSGITFRYSESGRPEGLCRAKRLVYITTAGGPIFANFGFDYVNALAGAFFGIPETALVKAEGLDILGADTEEIINAAKADYEASL